MNENFEYNESNVVFRDLILLTLTGFMSMVILLMPFIQTPTDTENTSVPPGNVIVELFWDNDRDVDIDLWVKAPEDIPVGYSNQGGLFFNLLRDDLGKYKDSTPVNYEVSYSRGISEGLYVTNLHLYREDETPFVPIIAKLVVSVVDPNTKERKQILKSQKNLKNIGEEITIFQFRLDKKGNLDKDSINNNFIPLRSGNKG